MTEENFKNKEKIEKKENVRKEGGRTRRPYNRKKKEFNNEEKEIRVSQEKNMVEVKKEENKDY